MDDKESLDSDVNRSSPGNLQKLNLPNDRRIRVAYSVYNPSEQALSIKSEAGRTIFAEKIETNPNLDTLENLCARALARCRGAEALKYSANNAYMRRLQLDSIDIDQPLEGIYEIDDPVFWKRVVIAKSKQPGVKLKADDFNWKAEGIALKFVEIVEKCPAEFRVESEMSDLISKIKDHITHLRIRSLQPLQDATVEHYFQRDSDTDKSSTTDVSSTTENDDREMQEDEVAQVEEEPKSPRRESVRINDRRRSSWSFAYERGYDESDYEHQENIRLMKKLIEQTNRRREERRKRRQAQIERRRLREGKRLARNEQQRTSVPKKIKVENVYGLPVVDPENQEHKKLDYRNMQSYLKLKRKKIFTPDRCDHIDLSFIQSFHNLVSFHIEFKPPLGKYEPRHFLFSHNDVRNLAEGIRNLGNLRTFRLRNSRMDHLKLATLVFVLNQLNVEEIDFGNDFLNDDCDMALRELFQGTTTIRSLELEGNHLGVSTMSRLGKALQRYAGKLEYLGLARNDIGNEGLHGLLSKIANKRQIESFNLAGIKISEMAIWCCICDELLQKHKILRYLDITGMPMSTRGGELLTRTMKHNYTLMGLDCRACQLSLKVETEIEIYLRRNRYMAENPFIGDESKTPEQIAKFISRVKNPVLLKVEEKLKKQQDCIIKSIDSMKSLTAEPSVQNVVDTRNSNTWESGSVSAKPATGRFVYDVTTLDYNQILKHVQIPGPANRRRNFKSKTDD